MILALFLGLGMRASGRAATAGNTLLEPASARSAGLADALSAASADLDAMDANPASLAGLAGTHISFQYQRGLSDDAFGSIHLGRSMGGLTLGLSAGAFDAGDAVIFDGISERSVKAQKDWMASLSGAGRLGRSAMGVSVKYLSSDIAETAFASAIAADLGIQVSMGRFSLGAAAQNIGEELKYVERSHPLPRLARAGGAYHWGNTLRGAGLYADARYRFEESDVVPAAGVELLRAPLALRVGYQFSARVDTLTAGAGVQFGRLRLDYAFGMASEFDDRHRVSFSAAFGGEERP